MIKFIEKLSGYSRPRGLPYRAVIIKVTHAFNYHVEGWGVLTDVRTVGHRKSETSHDEVAYIQECLSLLKLSAKDHPEGWYVPTWDTENDGWESTTGDYQVVVGLEPASYRKVARKAYDAYQLATRPLGCWPRVTKGQLRRAIQGAKDAVRHGKATITKAPDIYQLFDILETSGYLDQRKAMLEGRATISDLRVVPMGSVADLNLADNTNWLEKSEAVPSFADRCKAGRVAIVTGTLESQIIDLEEKTVTGQIGGVLTPTPERERAGDPEAWKRTMAYLREQSEQVQARRWTTVDRKDATTYPTAEQFVLTVRDTRKRCESHGRPLQPFLYEVGRYYGSRWWDDGAEITDAAYAWAELPAEDDARWIPIDRANAKTWPELGRTVLVKGKAYQGWTTGPAIGVDHLHNPVNCGGGEDDIREWSTYEWPTHWMPIKGFSDAGATWSEDEWQEEASIAAAEEGADREPYWDSACEDWCLDWIEAAKKKAGIEV